MAPMVVPLLLAADDRGDDQEGVDARVHAVAPGDG